MNKLLKCIDIILIQEHWLLDSTIVKLERSLQGVYVHGVSGIRETEFRAGRPFGGVAILWKANIKCKISPVQLLSRRMCAISIVIRGIHIVIYNCYMPCDTDHDHDNLTTFNDMLQEISDTSASLDAQHIVIGGDLNTDFRRLTSFFAYQSYWNIFAQ